MDFHWFVWYVGYQPDGNVNNNEWHSSNTVRKPKLWSEFAGKTRGMFAETPSTGRGHSFSFFHSKSSMSGKKYLAGSPKMSVDVDTFGLQWRDENERKEIHHCITIVRLSALSYWFLLYICIVPLHLIPFWVTLTTTKIPPRSTFSSLDFACIWLIIIRLPWFRILMNSVMKKNKVKSGSRDERKEPEPLFHVFCDQRKMIADNV